MATLPRRSPTEITERQLFFLFHEAELYETDIDFYNYLKIYLIKKWRKIPKLITGILKIGTFCYRCYRSSAEFYLI